MGIESGPKFNPEEKFHIERNGRVTTIEAPTASYMIVYGCHGTSDRSDSIPAHAKAVFLEASRNWTEEADGYKRYEKDVQYGALVGTLKKNNIPIYFGDPEINRAIALPVDIGILLGETALGIALLSRRTKETKQTKENSGKGEMNRRDFLKKMGKTMAGAYLYAPLLSKLGRIASHETNLEQGASAEISKRVNQIHPESMIILESFRNTVIAFKEQWVAEVMKNRPLIATVIGADHVSIEDAFQSSQVDKLEYLRKFKPVLNSLVSTPETFFTIRVNYPNGGSETLVIEELRGLWENDQ